MEKKDQKTEVDYIVMGNNTQTGESYDICIEKPKKKEDSIGRLLVFLRQETGMNRKEFAEHFGIPYRTIQDWELGNNPMPDYIYRLIAYQVANDKFFHKGGDADEKSSQ